MKRNIHTEMLTALTFLLLICLTTGQAETVELSKNAGAYFDATPGMLVFTEDYESPGLQDFLKTDDSGYRLEVYEGLKNSLSPTDGRVAVVLFQDRDTIYGWVFALELKLFDTDEFDYKIDMGRGEEGYKEALQAFAEYRSAPIDELYLSKNGQVFRAEPLLEEAYGGYGRVLSTVNNGYMFSYWIVYAINIEDNMRPLFGTMLRVLDSTTFSR